MNIPSCISTGLVVLGTGLMVLVASGKEPSPSFNRDIRPILAAKCFACHGPDEQAREADLRLDDLPEGLPPTVIVPGRPDQSELIRRIYSKDQHLRMPPSESGESLTPEQKSLLSRWVAAGASSQQHWAFVPPVRPPVPQVQNTPWPHNPIDRFVLARLQEQGLSPSPEADRYTLVRRLYLDLIGLPPTPQQAEAFVQDPHPQAYQRMVDRLLQSPHYGERWATPWLDLARYADTNGYEKDRPRSIWPFRDWVIKALNNDMPFDQFTTEQLAGDMLPEATNSQKVATGFHRNTMLNEEGGIDPLEYRFYSMVDRVATTGTVWLGLSVGCAQCHSHKYDPISHTEYYQFLALLNNADEPDLPVADEKVLATRQSLQQRIARMEAALPGEFPPDDGPGDPKQRRARNLQRHFEDWVETVKAQAVSWTVLRPNELSSNLPRLELLADGSVFSSGDITKRDLYTLRFPLEDLPGPLIALRLEVLPDDRLPAGGPGRAYYEGRQGDFFLSEVTAWANGQPVKFATASHSYGKISIGSGNAKATNVIDGRGSTGWSTSGGEGQAHQLVLNLAGPLEAKELEVKLLFERHFAASLGRFRFWATCRETSAPDQKSPQASKLPVTIEQLLTNDRQLGSDEQQPQLKSYFLSVTPQLASARGRIERLRKQLPSLPRTLILQERPTDHPRQTFRHHRGEYLSPREKVIPGIPAVVASLTERPVSNRLELARWLASRDNPLVARVTVNRAWRAFFGAGLMRTSGDFGTQSDPPSHPELLDWLACEFMDQGWSLKRLHRLIVTSATYRQSSHLKAELLHRDPGNRFLARGPRVRVEAEMVRDIMLAASGLLSSKMYGPSVYPPQPASVTALAWGNARWPIASGENRYRRSLYTFRKRTAPFAASTVFDGPTGENCIARRNRSNTPLQALTLLNDEMFLEMAQALGKSCFGQETDSASRGRLLFGRLLTRPPTDDELAAIVNFQKSQRKRLAAGEIDFSKILGQKASKADRPRSELITMASWVMTARALMNLDEVITKQ